MNIEYIIKVKKLIFVFDAYQQLQLSNLMKMKRIRSDARTKQYHNNRKVVAKNLNYLLPEHQSFLFWKVNHVRCRWNMILTLSKID